MAQMSVDDPEIDKQFRSDFLSFIFEYGGILFRDG
jgi:hypothetical protein